MDDWNACSINNRLELFHTLRSWSSKLNWNINIFLFLRRLSNNRAFFNGLRHNNLNSCSFNNSLSDGCFSRLGLFILVLFLLFIFWLCKLFFNLFWNILNDFGFLFWRLFFYFFRQIFGFLNNFNFLFGRFRLFFRFDSGLNFFSLFTFKRLWFLFFFLRCLYCFKIVCCFFSFRMLLV